MLIAAWVFTVFIYRVLIQMWDISWFTFYQNVSVCMCLDGCKRVRVGKKRLKEQAQA